MKKKYIIIGVILSLIVISIPFLKKTLNNKNPKQISLLDHKKVEGLYTKNENNMCTDVPSEESIGLFLTFGQMKKDKLLSDSIDMSTYKKEASKIVKDIKEDINYVYEGYRYTSNGNTITREKVDCDNNYVTKLYGYSQGKDNLSLTIKSGYIKDDKVYDLENNEIGEKEKLNIALDNGSTKTYIYSKDGNNYKFEKVEE